MNGKIKRRLQPLSFVRYRAVKKNEEKGGGE
jgi:hypothetical protein